MTLTQIDLADVITRDSALSGDRSHEISDFYAIPCSDGHEKPDHSGGRVGTSGSGAFTISHGSWTRGRRLIRFGLTALRSLAFENVEGRRSELSPIEFLEQRLERDDLACGNSAREHGAQLLPHSFLAIVCTPLGPVKI